MFLILFENKLLMTTSFSHFNFVVTIIAISPFLDAVLVNISYFFDYGQRIEKNRQSWE